MAYKNVLKYSISWSWDVYYYLLFCMIYDLISIYRFMYTYFLKSVLEIYINEKIYNCRFRKNKCFRISFLVRVIFLCQYIFRITRCVGIGLSLFCAILHSLLVNTRRNFGNIRPYGHTVYLSRIPLQ